MSASIENTATYRPLTLLAITLTALPAIAVTAASSKAEVINIDQLNKDGYKYVNTSDDGTIFFVKITKRISDTVFVEMVVIDDPDNNKKVYRWKQPYNCANKTYQRGDRKLKPIVPGTSMVPLFKWSCS